MYPSSENQISFKVFEGIHLKGGQQRKVIYTKGQMLALTETPPRISAGPCEAAGAMMMAELTFNLN